MQNHGTLFAFYETLYHYTIAKNFTTMMLFTDYFSRLKKNLRYGVIYVFTPSRKSNAEFNRLSPRLLHLLEKITGFKIEFKEAPHDMKMDTGTTLISRRFNVGNAGKDAVVRMDLNTDSFSDIVRFAESAIDVVGTDEGDQVLTAKINIHEENPDELEVFAASGINNYFDNEVKTRYSIWVAQYYDRCTYTGTYKIWQKSSKGRVNGITGDVDLDESYEDFPKIIKNAHLNGF